MQTDSAGSQSSCTSLGRKQKIIDSLRGSQRLLDRKRKLVDKFIPYVLGGSFMQPTFRPLLTVYGVSLLVRQRFSLPNNSKALDPCKSSLELFWK